MTALTIYLFCLIGAFYWICAVAWRVDDFLGVQPKNQPKPRG
jgi:hypothetical protein